MPVNAKRAPGPSREASGRAKVPNAARRAQALSLEFGLVAAGLILLNAPWWSEGTRLALSFAPSLVAQGEWWRLFTYPFVHVTWYHFLLDGAAFLALYWGLMGCPARERAAEVGLSAAGSLGLAWLLEPEIGVVGLCGLSGVAHGMMAASGLRMLRASGGQRAERWIGGVLLGLVLAKSLVELAAGQPFFALLHFGLMGTPVVSCHLGGVLGGILAARLGHLRFEI